MCRKPGCKKVAVMASKVAFSSQSGEMLCLPLDCIPLGSRHTGELTAAAVMSSLSKVLRAEAAPLKQTRGLPLQAASARAHQFCVSICVDRAYSGKTGTKADAFVSQALGVPVRLRKRRKCSSSSSSPSSSGSESGSSSSWSESQCDSARDPNGRRLRAWIEMVRVFRAKFRRGIPRTHLAEAYKAEGINNLSVMGPSNTRMIVHCGAFLDQSLRHWRGRYIAAMHLQRSLPERGLRPELRRQQQVLQKLASSLVDVRALTCAQEAVTC